MKLSQACLGVLLLCGSLGAAALEPYVHADRQAAADLTGQMARVEQKLTAAGFSVVGRHQPPGLPDRGTLIVTDKGLLEAVRGAGIMAAPLRVGVSADGQISYANPEYWLRALLRGQPEVAGRLGSSLRERLGQALGAGKAFGGNVPAADLPDYRYMIGMERFETRAELRDLASFDEALKTVRDNLAAKVGKTLKVYEIVLPERRVAVFGVAMNDSSQGEGWWVPRIGADHMAALPYEVYIVDGKIMSPFGRYRIALGWPALGMGTFMGIVNAPGIIQATLGQVAGASPAN
ncbi:MAG: hypothetical protein J0M20_06425 [Burkholderiales bacterium]|nr:hypothetical protein [Burkholderiales bacterium]